MRINFVGPVSKTAGVGFFVLTARRTAVDNRTLFHAHRRRPSSSPALIDYVSDLDDPRRTKSTDYPLHEIVILTVCAVICGADGFTSIASFGEAKKNWLGKFLELENGIPSHDTIVRFFGLLDPEAFEACFSRWVRSACEHIDEEVVAIDGKTLRRSYDRESNKAALHMVSARASENGLALGQVKRRKSRTKSRPFPSFRKS
jgi:predicted transposase YbfD/YdcC